MKQVIYHWQNGGAVFAAALAPRFAGAALGRCRGEAARLAVAARANLDGAELSGADMRGIDFSGARLRNARLCNARLDGASFSRADLRQASLRGAHLIKADLGGTEALGADFGFADLTGASLSGAWIRGAFFDTSVWADGGTNVRGHAFGVLRVPGARPIYRAGCREWASLAAALAHYDEDYAWQHGKTACAEGRARLQLAHAVATERGFFEGEPK